LKSDDLKSRLEVIFLHYDFDLILKHFITNEFDFYFKSNFTGFW